jgi:DNA-binding MurR/RpiR family transcriptional regulator
VALSGTSGWDRDVRSPLVLIAQALDQLHEAERRVADFVTNNPEAVVHSTVAQIASAAGTSSATVVRFCRTVGLRGFPELRLSLARDMMRQAQDPSGDDELNHEDRVDRAAYAVFSRQQQALADTMEIQQAVVLERAVAAIGAANRVIISSESDRVAIAREAERRLTSIGVVAYSAPEEGGLTSLSAIGTGDVLLVFSGSSTSRRYSRMLAFARTKGATSILVTPTIAGSLEAEVDIALPVSGALVEFAGLTMESIIAEFALVEALMVGIAMQDVPRTLAAIQLGEADLGEG